MAPDTIPAVARPRRAVPRRGAASNADGRLSRRRLAEFCAEWATDAYTLVVHSVDLDHRRFFPNSFVVGKRRSRPAHLYVDPHYRDLRLLESGSFDVIVCTGLLEHIPDPPRLIGEFFRILRPGGRLVLSASAVFPFHGSPDNFFHFTPNGFRLLFQDWSRFEVLRGATGPFETIGVLLQRISLQCALVPPLRPLLSIAARAVPVLDTLVLRQYDSNTRRDPARETDAFMPVALHAVVVR